MCNEHQCHAKGTTLDATGGHNHRFVQKDILVLRPPPALTRTTTWMQSRSSPLKLQPSKAEMQICDQCGLSGVKRTWRVPAVSDSPQFPRKTRASDIQLTLHMGSSQLLGDNARRENEEPQVQSGPGVERFAN